MMKMIPRLFFAAAALSLVCLGNFLAADAFNIAPPLSRAAVIAFATRSSETDGLTNSNTANKGEQLQQHDDDGDSSLSMMDVSTEKQQQQQQPPDNRLLHLGLLGLGTLWWYLFSSYELIVNSHGFLGMSQGLLYDAMAAYVTISQLCTYFFLWQLMNAQSLRAGQFWIGLCIFACVPADTIVILFDPTGNASATVCAFTLVTLIYGMVLAYYLRQAAYLEQQPMMMIQATATGATTAAAAAAQVETTNNFAQNGSIIAEVLNYRPPANIQNTHLATDFARAFGAFTVTVAAIRDQIQGVDNSNVGWVFYVTLAIVTLHSALDMTLTTITPGINLSKFPSFVKFQTGMALFQMFAASYIAHVAPGVGDVTIWDDLIYSCLFGSAASSMAENIELLSEGVDFDKKVGMANNLANLE